MPKTDPNPILAVYATSARVPSLTPNGESDLRSILNFAHGYPDGKCNTVDPVTSEIVPKKKRGEEPELEEAHYNLRRVEHQLVYVALRKDGSKTLYLTLPPGMVKVSRYLWVPRGQKARIKAMLVSQLKNDLPRIPDKDQAHMKILNTPLTLPEILVDLSRRTNRRVACIQKRKEEPYSKMFAHLRIFVFEAKEYDKPWHKPVDIEAALSAYNLGIENSYPTCLKNAAIADFRPNTITTKPPGTRVYTISYEFLNPEVYHDDSFLSEPERMNEENERRYILPPGWYPKDTSYQHALVCGNNYPYPSVLVLDPSQCSICWGRRGCHTFLDFGGPHRYSTRICSDCVDGTLKSWSQLVARVAT